MQPCLSLAGPSVVQALHHHWSSSPSAGNEVGSFYPLGSLISGTVWFSCMFFGLHPLSSTLPLGVILSTRPHLPNFYWGVPDTASVHSSSLSPRLWAHFKAPSPSVSHWQPAWIRNGSPSQFLLWIYNHQAWFHIQNYFQPPVLSPSTFSQAASLVVPLKTS